MPRTETPQSTPPAVLWIGYALILLGFGAILWQLPWPTLGTGPTALDEVAVSLPPAPVPAGETKDVPLDPAVPETIAAPPPPPQPVKEAVAPASAPPPERPVSLPAALATPPPVRPTARRASPPPPRAHAPVAARSMLRGNPELSQVLLSFDGGSGTNSAAPILDALDRRNVHTTFFLTGTFIRRYPDLVREIVARGHEVGNHTDRHPHLTTWEMNRTQTTRPGVDRGFLRRELRSAEESFRKVTGASMAPLWRAPYGEVNREILGWAAEAGYEHVGWTGGFDSLDWVEDAASPRYRSPEEFLETIADRVAHEPQALNGAIILMHLDSGRPMDERMASRVGDLMSLLQGAGYELVPASTLLRNLAATTAPTGISR